VIVDNVQIRSLTAKSASHSIDSNVVKTILENAEFRWSALTNGIQICNRLPPGRPGLERHVARVLEWVDQPSLAGLKRIELVDQLPSGEMRVSPRYRAQIASGMGLRGWYADPTMTSEPAYIVLYIPHILSALPRWLWWTSAATILIARTLAHEVAHHIVRSSGVKMSSEAEEESAANNYALDMRTRIRRLIKYRLGEWLIREVADDHWLWGLTCWKDGEHERAVRHFLQALRLVPDHQDANHWYWWATHEIEEKKYWTCAI